MMLVPRYSVYSLYVSSPPLSHSTDVFTTLYPDRSRLSYYHHIIPSVPPASLPSLLRGPQLVALLCTAQAYSASSVNPLDTAMQEMGFEHMAENLLKRQNTLARYIAMRPIVDLLEEMVRMLGVRME